MSQETPELFTGEQGGRAESSNIFFYVYDDVVLLYYLLFFLGDDRTPLKFCNFGFLFPVNVLVFFCLLLNRDVIYWE